MTQMYDETQPIWFKQGGYEGVGYIRGYTMHTNSKGTTVYWIVEIVKVVGKYRDEWQWQHSCMTVAGENINAVSQAYIGAWVDMQKKLDETRPKLPLGECDCVAL